MQSNVYKEDNEQQDQKPDTHHTLGSKKVQEEFDKKQEEVMKRISDLNGYVVGMNKKLNERNNILVHNVSQIINEVLNDAEEGNYP